MQLGVGADLVPGAVKLGVDVEDAKVNRSYTGQEPPSCLRLVNLL
jgi:hypothetical protein